MYCLEIISLLSTGISLWLLSILAKLIGGLKFAIEKKKIIKYIILYFIVFIVNIAIDFISSIKAYGTTYLTIPFIFIIILDFTYTKNNVGKEEDIIKILTNKRLYAFYGITIISFIFMLLSL